MMVARQFCRNSSTTKNTSIIASISVLTTSLIEIFTYWSVSYGIVYAMPFGKSALQLFEARLDRAAGLQRVGAGLQEDRDQHRRLAVELRRGVVGLRAELDARDVLRAARSRPLRVVCTTICSNSSGVCEPALRLSPR